MMISHDVQIFHMDDIYDQHIQSHLLTIHIQLQVVPIFAINI
jgi:hypothetical protein